MPVLFGMRVSPFNVLYSSNQPVTRGIHQHFSQFIRRCFRIAFYVTIALIFAGISVGVLLGLLIAATFYRVNLHSESRGRIIDLENPVILSTVKISSIHDGPAINSSKQVKAEQLTRKLGLGSKEEFGEIKREKKIEKLEPSANSSDELTEFSPYFIQAPPLNSRGRVNFSFGGGSTALLSDGSEDWKLADSNNQRGVYGFMSSRASREIRQSFSDDSDAEAREDQPLLNTRDNTGFNTTAELSPNSQIEFYSRFRLPPDATNNPQSEDINADGYTISPRHHKSGSVSSNHYFLSIN